MSQFQLNIWVTRDFPRGFTHVIAGSFADPQSSTQAATDLFCYDRNTGVGAFFATVKNGRLDDGTPVPDGPHKVGGESYLWQAMDPHRLCSPGWRSNATLL